MSGKDIQSFCVTIEFRDGVTQKQRRRFWRRTERALLQRSLVFERLGSLFVVLAVGHNFGDPDRRHVISWLIDQVSIRKIHAGPQAPALDLPDAPIEMEGLDEEKELRLRAILFMLVDGAFTRYRRVLAEGTHAVPEVFRRAR